MKLNSGKCQLNIIGANKEKADIRIKDTKAKESDEEQLLCIVLHKKLDVLTCISKYMETKKLKPLISFVQSFVLSQIAILC